VCSQLEFFNLSNFRSNKGLKFEDLRSSLSISGVGNFFCLKVKFRSKTKGDTIVTILYTMIK